MARISIPLMVVLLAALLATSSCKNSSGRTEGEPITAVWSDDFERDNLGPNYYATTSNYQLTNGAMGAKGALNHPLWLTKKLPQDVSIEFDCWSNSEAGDIKVEFFGDGSSHAPTKKKVAYTATGYVAVMGGWGNSKSLLARRDEHGKSGVDLSERATPKVIVGQRYHWKLVRKGKRIEWFVDDMDTVFLAFDDQAPLVGPGQEYFGFNNWETDTWFDNLRITPL